MPSIRKTSENSTSPVPRASHSRFSIPQGYHLLITTRTHVSTWDSQGSRVVFKSSKHGIVAATEAKDGSGMLAIADKQVVVLHDTRRGQEKSWGLNADDDEVRHLEYTAATKSLFLTTALTSDIQCYSTELHRLINPCLIAVAAPSALAVSSTGHLLLSATRDPPVVYLKDLLSNALPTPIETTASDTAVSITAFHPERPDLFLLGFKDGTVAAYDASKMEKYCTGGSYSNQAALNVAEIGQLVRIHRATGGPAAACIAGAAFMPGYKTRAVSVGWDGRCHVLDFADGGRILRTWQVKAALISVSVVSTKQMHPNESHRGLNRRSISSRSDNLIAVGREDGKVHIYDSAGTLLAQKVLSVDSENIVSLEWIKGPSPKQRGNNSAMSSAQDLSSLSTLELGHQRRLGKASTKEISAPLRTKVSKGPERQEYMGLSCSLPKQGGEVIQSIRPLARQFTTHPDELESTVRYNPIVQNLKFQHPRADDYLNLFSPVKSVDQAVQAVQNAMPKVQPGPQRFRPRISSQTFTRTIESPTPDEESPIVAEPRNLALFPSTGSDSGNAQRPASPKEQPLQTARESAKRRISIKGLSNKGIGKSTPSKLRSIASHNANVLANLRKMDNIHPTLRAPAGVLSTYARPLPLRGTQPQTASCGRKGPHILHRPDDHIEVTSKSEHHARRAYEDAHTRSKWPEDSNQGSSLDGDIWMGSEPEHDVRLSRQLQRRLHEGERPPARTRSRSTVNELGTIGTCPEIHAHESPTAAPAQARLDGSTEADQPFVSEPTHVSPSGDFTPSSNDVRGLFPRSSSLSHRARRHHRKSGGTDRKSRALRELALNTTHCRDAKNPWDRMRAQAQADNEGVFALTSKEIVSRVHFHGIPMNDHTGSPKRHEQSCENCSITRARMSSLENETARLKGEVLALKAVLRQNGLAVPMLLQGRVKAK